MRTRPPGPRSSPGRRRMWWSAMLVCAAIILAGCDDDPDLAQPGLAEETEVESGLPAAAGEAQPGVDGAPVDGDFADVPMPSGATPFAPSTVEDGVTVQTFEVTATTPASLAEFFRAEMPPLGWEEGAESVSILPSEGTQNVQLTWTMDGQTMLITIADIDGIDSQYSLQLSS